MLLDKDSQRKAVDTLTCMHKDKYLEYNLDFILVQEYSGSQLLTSVPSRIWKDPFYVF